MRGGVQIEQIAAVPGTALLDEIRRDALRNVGEHGAGGNSGAKVEESLIRGEEEVSVEDSVAEGAAVGGAQGGCAADAEDDVVKGAIGGREEGRFRRDPVERVEYGRAFGVGVVAVEGKRVVGADLNLDVAGGVTAVAEEVVRVGLEQGGRVLRRVEIDLVVDVRVGVG